MTTPSSLTIFCDGGSRGNPGLAASAFVVLAHDAVIFEQGVYLGVKTNNEAEYLAVLASLKWLSSLDQPPASVTWQLDSQLVVEQLSGRWKVKDPKMQILKAKCFELLDSLFPLSSYQFVHLRRALNARADALVNQVLDQHQT